MMDNFARIPGNFTHENLKSDLKDYSFDTVTEADYKYKEYVMAD